MRKTSAVHLLPFVLLLGLVACETEEPETAPAAEPVAEAGAATDVEAARTAVARVRDDWTAAAERDDAARVASLYADDAVVVSAENEVARGREEIQRTFGEAFPMASNLRITSEDFDVSGDLAYDMGEYTQQITPPNGQPITDTGRYLVVLRRQPDGNWRIVRHLNTAATPAPAGAQ